MPPAPAARLGIVGLLLICVRQPGWLLIWADFKGLIEELAWIRWFCEILPWYCKFCYCFYFALIIAAGLPDLSFQLGSIFFTRMAGD